MAANALLLRAPPTFVRWWQAKNPRERRIVVSLVAFVAVVVAWLAIWQPLQRDLVTLRATAVAEHRTLAGAQRMADEIASLARTAPTPGPADVRAALDRVLTQRGLRSAVTELNWQEGRGRVVFTAVNFDALIAALEALQRESGLRIVEATLTAHVDPGIVSAELVLAR